MDRELQARLAKLTPGQRELLRARMASEGVGKSHKNLTSLQQKQFFVLNETAGNPAAYAPLKLLVIKGPLDVEKLQRSLREVISNASVLNQKYTFKEGELTTCEGGFAPLDLIPIQYFDEGVSFEDWATSEMEELIHKPFDLEEDEPYRIKLFRKSTTLWALGLIFHHIAFDGDSSTIFLESMAKVYEGSGHPARIDYWQYADRQNRRLTPAVRKKAIDFWGRQLSNSSGVIGFPYDHQLTSKTRDIRCFIPISDEAIEGVKSLARSLRCTSNLIYLSAYFIFLHQITNDSQIRVGQPVSIRPDVRDVGMIGCCINTVCLHADFDSLGTFHELLASLSSQLRDALEFAEFNIFDLSDRLQQDTSDSEIYSTLFQLRNFQVVPKQMGDCQLSVIDATLNGAQFPFAVDLWPNQSPAQLVATADANLFRTETVESLLQRFGVLLDVIVRDCRSVRIGAPLFSKDDRALMQRVNSTLIEFDCGENLTACFETVAARLPNEVAMCFKDFEATYAELAESSKLIAGSLQALGVERGDRVAVHLKRGEDLLPTLLGILFAGACYVPIDPEYPAARKLAIIEDARLEIVVTNLTIPDVSNKVRAVRASELWEGGVDGFKPVEIAGDDIAYIMFTSGSTGRPKGVPISHRAVVNLLESLRRTLPLSDDVRFLATTTISFDISVVELFLPLVCGGRVVVTSDELKFETPRLRAQLEDGSINVFQATPSLWQILLDSGWRGNDRLLGLTGGEKLARAMADEILARTGELWNLYGPTEATVYCTASQVLRDEAVTVGTPLPNTGVHVLNSSRHPVPPGIWGELCLSGVSLTSGYLGRDDLTSQQFITSSEIDDHPIRLYRTGDVARINRDGRIELRGRIDGQIKLRGHRIETSEIERHLALRDDVRSAHVTLRSTPEGSEVLTCYYTAASNHSGEGTLIDYLAEIVPSYMVPGVWVKLDEFPVTSNGKIDSRRLPLPTFGSSEICEPESPAELQLLEIWKDLFGKEMALGCDDNFFRIGGNSILAMRLLAKVREDLDPTISLKILFQYPTIREFSRYLDSREQSSSTVVDLRPSKKKPALYMLHGWGGEVFAQAEFVSRLKGDFSVHGVQAVEHGGDEAPLQNFEAMAERYAHDIREHAQGDPVVLCGYSLGGLIAFEAACQLQKIGVTVLRLFVIDTGCRNLPGHIYYHALAPYLAGRALEHLRGVAKLSPAAWPGYFSGRMKALAIRFRLAPAEGHVPDPGDVGEDLPPNYYARISARYHPTPTNLSVTVFKSSGNHHDLERIWKYLGKSAPKLHDIEATHHHLLQDARLSEIMHDEMINLSDLDAARGE